MKVNTTTISKIQNQSDMNDFVSTLGITSDTVLLKPTEGVFTNSFMNWDINKSIPFYDWGIIVGGPDSLEVDIIACKVLGTKFNGPISTLGEEFRRIFGGNTSVDITNIPQEWFQKH